MAESFPASSQHRQPANTVAYQAIKTFAAFSQPDLALTCNIDRSLHSCSALRLLAPFLLQLIPSSLTASHRRHHAAQALEQQAPAQMLSQSAYEACGYRITTAFGGDETYLRKLPSPRLRLLHSGALKSAICLLQKQDRQKTHPHLGLFPLHIRFANGHPCEINTRWELRSAISFQYYKRLA